MQEERRPTDLKAGHATKVPQLGRAQCGLVPGDRGVRADQRTLEIADQRTLEIGGDRIELAWHGANHTPDNIYIHFPDHDTLMLIDVVNSGWAPVYTLNLSENVPGYIEAGKTALSYPWTHLISGHLGRLANRDDVKLHQQYLADIEASARRALGEIDPHAVPPELRR